MEEHTLALEKSGTSPPYPNADRQTTYQFFDKAVIKFFHLFFLFSIFKRYLRSQKLASVCNLTGLLVKVCLTVLSMKNEINDF